MFDRLQIFEDSEDESLFLWGSRQTGKSTLLKTMFPKSLYFDLLLSDVYLRIESNPATIREAVLATNPTAPVIIDEVQKVPILLDEVHWLIENTNTRFILSGSSPRKILRSGANLLGGRALRYELFPLIYKEIPDFDLFRALNHGLLPKHYLAKRPGRLISSYIGSFLRDEIVAEAQIRNIPSFTRFLEVAALSNGETLNYTNIARECGVASPTAKEYFQILVDTLAGRFVPSYQRRAKRRVVVAPRFYFFDVGIANYLLKRKSVEPGNEVFGKAFEHFIYMELSAHSSYSGLHYPITYWRTTSQAEVDFILGDEVAIEVKSSKVISLHHLKGLKTFADEFPSVKHKILVCTDPMPRQVGDILILPWNVFLDKLWAGELIS